MPTPHPHRTGSPATPAQQRYLRSLAERTGTTFSPPRNRADASAQIKRLKARTPDTRGDVARERRDVHDDLGCGRGDATRHRPGDVTGYGSGAHWAHGDYQEGER